MNIPKRVCERLTSGMKQMRPIIEQQKARDVSEADTVTLVKDLLADVFGFDKYAELTSEHLIRGTFCDLAIKIDDKLVALVETKAIGISLNDSHVKQAVDYAANQGVEWVALTNSITWRLYHVLFNKPIDKQLIAEFDLTAIDCKKEDHNDLLFLFTKEGFMRGAQAEMRDRRDATSRYVLAALILNNESVLNTIRRELKKLVDINVDMDDIEKGLREQVIKRDVLEGPEAEAAVRRVEKSAKKMQKQKTEDTSDDQAASTEPTVGSAAQRTATDSPGGSST